MERENKSVNFEAYFLGPKGENYEYFKKLLENVFSTQIKWRRAFHARDSVDFITEGDKNRKDFKRAQKIMEDYLYYLANELEKSQPFFSPRYIGHMNWEIMFAPTIAFFLSSLYNPNNVAYAGSTATSQLEIEVGRDFLRILGMNEDKGWGHICAGGTIANIEALWIARNMKYAPLVLRRLLKYFKVKDCCFNIYGRRIDLINSEAERLIRAFNPDEILELRDYVFNKLRANKIEDEEIENQFELFSLQHQGLRGVDTGVVYLPQTKHYSFKKALDLLGIGRGRARYVPVDEHFRIDVRILERMLRAEREPVLAVVGVLGSTEESSVDPIDKLVKLRERLHREVGIGFHLHVDAAYGGYAKTIFFDKNGRFFADINKMKRVLKRYKIVDGWPSPEVFRAYKAVGSADTVTIDPHKLGYVLYPAGGIAMRDKRMREFIQAFAPYVFGRPKKDSPDVLIGSYILEGSRPGGSASAVWIAHRVMPLNITGYGKLIGETIDGALHLYGVLKKAKPFVVSRDIKIVVHPLSRPDLNIVNYVFNIKGNKDLEIMNTLTEYVCESVLGFLPEKGKTMLERVYIASSTELTREEYGDSVLPFLKKIGIPEKEWERVRRLKVVRSVIMSPYLTSDYVEKDYAEDFIAYLKSEINSKAVEILEKVFRERLYYWIDR